MLRDRSERPRRQPPASWFAASARSGAAPAGPPLGSFIATGQGIRPDADPLRGGRVFALRLGLTESPRALLQVFERWDGKGDPGGLDGEELSPRCGSSHWPTIAEVFHRAGGIEGAVKVVRDRPGTHFDPASSTILRAGPDCSRRSTPTRPGTGDRRRAPLPGALRGELDPALEAIADFADLKSPHTLGHSRAVADLAGDR